MDDLYIPLSEDETYQLDQFLKNRVDKEILTKELDQGIFDISTLDGFFTAIISGPVMIPPSVWLPVVWGDYEQEWESDEAFTEILTLMMRHINSIVQVLMDYPNEFEPIFIESKVDDKIHTVVDAWCEGYYLGTKIFPEQWLTDDTEMAVLLTPIYAFTQATDWVGYKSAKQKVEKRQHEITVNARKIYAYWLERRSYTPPQDQLIMRSQPKIGRNDPCPCGSGKKYKKCCLH